MPFNYTDALVCDMVVPWEPQVGNGVPLLERFHAAGVTFVSVHPAGDRHGTVEALERIAKAKADILSDPGRFVLVNSVADIEAAKRKGLLAVGLHLEGSNPFEGDPSVVEAFFDVGIRFVHPVFNRANAFGGGSADLEDRGLTAFGVKCIEAMDQLGILSDGAHTGRRTTLEMMRVSRLPVLLSHAGCDAVFSHYRNFTDEQIIACAETGGVVGISGANNYLGGDPTPELIFRHVDHVARLVGPAHVGIGFDTVLDTDFLNAFVRERPDEWRGTWMPWQIAVPETIPPFADLLVARGYADTDIAGIMGGNWLRAGGVWKG
jgi:membrane dipeptidase